MTEYNYARVAIGGRGYDIDNREREDAEGEQVYLYGEIGVALPGKTFKIVCEDTSCVITFDVALSGAEKTTLDSVVSDHKNNI